MLAAFIRKAGKAVMPHIPRILEAVFDTTLAMITANMLDFPEHRLNFYLLLKVSCTSMLNFYLLFKVSCTSKLNFYLLLKVSCTSMSRPNTLVAYGRMH